MFLIDKTGKGLEGYLTDQEKAHLEVSKKSYESYLSSYKKEDSIESQMEYLESKPNHSEAKFIGTLAKNWSLEYSPENFKSVLNNIKPGTDKSVIRERKDQKKGDSAVFAMQKSLSIFYSLQPVEVQIAIRKEIEETIKDITENQIQSLYRPSSKNYFTQLEADEEFKKTGKKVSDSHIFIPEKTQSVFALHTHYENRGIEPHVHIHSTKPNFSLYKMKDGSEVYMADDNVQVLQSQKFITANFQTILKGRLERNLGIRTEKYEHSDNRHSFSIQGISRESEIKASSRREEVLNAFSKKELSVISSISSAMRKENFRKATTSKKIEHGANEIHKILNDFSSKIIDKQDLDLVQANASRVFTPFNKYNVSRSKVLDFEGQTTKENILSEISNELRFTANFQTLNQLKSEIDKKFFEMVSSVDLVQLENGNYTTKEIILDENRVCVLAGELNNYKSNPIFTYYGNQELEKFLKYREDNGRPLNEGQTKACEMIAGDLQISIVNGLAGSGKTSSVIQFTADLHKKQDFEVFGLSLQKKTGKALSEVGIKKTSSIQGFLQKYLDENGNLDESKVIKEFSNKKKPSLIIDEASMIGSSHMEKLLRITKLTNGKIVLIGDENQLGSVLYGNAFANVKSNIDDKNISFLTEVVRQKNEVAKTMAGLALAKNPEFLLEYAEVNKLLSIDETKDKVIEKISNDYINSKTSVSDKVVLAWTNEDVNKLNDGLREKIIKEQKNPSSPYFDNKNKIDLDNQYFISTSIKGKDNYEDRQFGVNDKIVFTKNVKLSKTSEIENSQTATITGFKESKDGLLMEISFKDSEGNLRNEIVNTKKNKDFQYAYALTIYQSQGITKEENFVLLDKSLNSNANYVACSRHTQTLNLYIEKSNIEDYKKNAKISQSKKTTLGDKNAMNALVKFKETHSSKVKEQMNKKQNATDSILLSKEIRANREKSLQAKVQKETKSMNAEQTEVFQGLRNMHKLKPKPIILK